MRVLALRGAHVIGTARTWRRARKRARRSRARTTPVALELTDFPSVVACAKRIRASSPRLDILILNAGIVLDKLEQVYGIEKQFVVNHLGHFLLTNRVLDLVRAAPHGRVVTVGSGNHRDAPPGGIQFDNLSGRAGRSAATRTRSSRMGCSLSSSRIAWKVRVRRRTASLPERCAPTSCETYRRALLIRRSRRRRERRHSAMSRQARSLQGSRANTSRTATRRRRASSNGTSQWRGDCGRSPLSSRRNTRADAATSLAARADLHPAACAPCADRALRERRCARHCALPPARFRRDRAPHGSWRRAVIADVAIEDSGCTRCMSVSQSVSERRMSPHRRRRRVRATNARPAR